MSQTESSAGDATGSSGSSTSTADGSDEDGTGTEGDLSALVDVSMECTRGDRLSELPFDPETVDLVAGQPDDTPWTTQVVTITNRAEVAVAVTPGFVVRYLGEDGATLGEESFHEPFLPAFQAAPGQTVRRNVVRFDVPGLAAPVDDAELAEQLFVELESCEIVDDVTATVTTADALIDADLADRAEFVDCGLNDAGDRFEGVLTVMNPDAEPLTVDFTFEIVDDEGVRLGIGGNDGDRVEGSGQADLTGWAAAFTVLDIDQADDCLLFTLSGR